MIYTINLDKKNNWIVFDATTIVSEKNVSGIITSDKTYFRTDNGMMIVVSTDKFIHDFKINKMSDETREKMQQTLKKIVNESTGGVICIII